MQTTFNEIEGLDLIEARRGIDFEVVTEPLESAETHSATNLKLVRRVDNGERVGVIHKRRNPIPYANIMDWVTSSMDDLGYQFKLTESLIMSNSDLYQEYVLNRSERGPDGTDFAPMLLVRGSYSNMPMKADMGTYRFVCSNGVVVGQQLASIRVNATETSDLLQSSVQNDLSHNMDRFGNIAGLYRGLQDKPMTPYLMMMLMDLDISAKIKKLVLAMLMEEGSVEVLKEKIKAADFQNPETLVRVAEDTADAWGLYNVLTQVVTHKTRSAGTRHYTYSKISNIFGI